jgi:phosphoglycerate dehydrogenase-like enzyme
MASTKPVIVVEDDVFARLVQVVLDPDSVDPQRPIALADFFEHDEPDFAGLCRDLVAQVPGLYPADVRLVGSTEDFHANLPDADAVIVEAMPVGATELRLAQRLKVVQKHGVTLRNIDLQACQARGIKVLTVRRRPNIGCAETAFAFMLSQAKKLNQLHGLISAELVEAAGYPYRPFDRRHTANSNWPRVPGLRTLSGSTIGIIGLGEIGREVALRAKAFDMRIVYHQRTRLDRADEEALGAQYLDLKTLLGESDWIVPLLPNADSTRNLLDRERLAQAKHGAFIVNVGRAEVIDRTALIDALRSGQIGGFALDPLYDEPGRSDDELLDFDNVILTPHIAAQPRFNSLSDLRNIVLGIGRALAG